MEESGAEEESKHGEKPHKRRRKKKVIRQLDDEDFDLINENAGRNIAQRKKRLQKVADREHPPAVKGEDEEAAVK